MPAATANQAPAKPAPASGKSAGSEAEDRHASRTLRGSARRVAAWQERRVRLFKVQGRTSPIVEIAKSVSDPRRSLRVPDLTPPAPDDPVDPLFYLVFAEAGRSARSERAESGRAGRRQSQHRNSDASRKDDARRHGARCARPPSRGRDGGTVGHRRPAGSGHSVGHNRPRWSFPDQSNSALRMDARGCHESTRLELHGIPSGAIPRHRTRSSRAAAECHRNAAGWLSSHGHGNGSHHGTTRRRCPGGG